MKNKNNYYLGDSKLNLDNENYICYNKMEKDYINSLNAFSFNFNKGDIIEGDIEELKDDNAIVYIKSKETAFINLKKEKIKKEELTIGQKLSFKIKEIDDNGIELSIKDYVQQSNYDLLLDSINKDIYFDAHIDELVNKSGFFVTVNNIKCFMPGSLADINRIWNFESLVNKDIKVGVVNFEKNNIVVSRKKYLETLIPDYIDNLNIEDYYEGIVTGSSKIGIFVKFNDVLTGLIYESDMDSKTKQKFNDRKVIDGSKIKFKVKYINGDKIILTQNDYDDWVKYCMNIDYNKVYKINFEKYVKNGFLFNLKENDIIKVLYNQKDLEKIRIKYINFLRRKIIFEVINDE